VEEQNAYERAQIAAKHLVGNLWYNLDAVPLIAGKLAVETMDSAVGGDAALAYAEMCNLMRSSTGKVTAGQLEANLKATGFNRQVVNEWQRDLANDDIHDLYEYVKEIQNAADLRKLQADCSQAMRRTQAYDANAERIKAELLSEMVKVNKAVTGPRHISEIIREVDAEFKRTQSGEQDWGVSTGIASLDRAFKLQDGNYITIGGRPSQGKTSLAVWIAYKRAEQLVRDGENGQVLIFSLDDTDKKLVRALACTVAGVDSNTLRNRTATAADWAEVYAAEDYLETLPLWIDETPGLTAAEIHFRAAMQNAQQPVRLLMVDYIEKVTPAGRGDSLQLLKAVANDLKNIGRAFKCPMMVLSQLTKDVERRADRWPTASDLLYAGEAESDVIVLVNRPEHYISRGEDIDCEDVDREGVVLLNVAKVKEGKVGLVRLAFQKEYARFADLHTEQGDSTNT
jgi:replicative DNA helicase